MGTTQDRKRKKNLEWLIKTGGLAHGRHPIAPACRIALTFDSDLRHSFDDAKAAHGHAGVVRRLANAA